MTASRRVLGSDSTKVDRHVVQPDEYDEAPELDEAWFEGRPLRGRQARSPGAGTAEGRDHEAAGDAAARPRRSGTLSRHRQRLAGPDQRRAAQGSWVREKREVGTPYLINQSPIPATLDPRSSGGDKEAAAGMVCAGIGPSGTMSSWRALMLFKAIRCHAANLQGKRTPPRDEGPCVAKTAGSISSRSCGRYAPEELEAEGMNEIRVTTFDGPGASPMIRIVPRPKSGARRP